MDSLAHALALGRAALSHAQWAEARIRFERAAALDPDPAAVLDGLSEARGPGPMSPKDDSERY